MRMFRSARLAVPVFAAMIGLKAGIARAGTNVWTTSGPEGGNISALAIDPSTPATLYAAVYRGGVFKSTNGGGNWSPLGGPAGPFFYLSLAIDPVTPSTVYVGADDGVYKSVNGGTGPGPAQVCLARTFTPWRSIPSRPRLCTPRLPISAFSRASTAGETGPWPPQV